MKLAATCLTLAAIVACAFTTKLSAQAPTAGDPKPVVSQTSTQEFHFKGGSFDEFLTRLRATYGKEPLEMLDIAGEPLPPRIPRMRIPVKDTDIRSAFYLYNTTSQAGDWYLGKWIFYPEHVRSDIDKPLRTLVFFPPKLAKPANTGGIIVRAFNISSIKPENRGQLSEIVEAECHKLRDDIESGRLVSQDTADAVGRISYHESSGVLVATGGKIYVELVASLVDAFEKQRTSGEPVSKP